MKYVNLFLIILVIPGSIYAKDKSTPNLKAAQSISQAFSRIKNSFVDEVSDDDLIEGCIAGMVSGIDSDSSYLNHDKFQELISAKKDNAGIGLTLAIKNGYPVVIAPIEGSPADRAGIKSGDLLLSIDDEDIVGQSLETVVAKLRGNPQTKVRLKLARVNHNIPMILSIEREPVRISNIKQKLLENNIGYIRISAFSTNTASSLKNNIRTLIKRAGNQLSGLIIDLRNNPGGLLSEGVAVADTFLDSGLIVAAKIRNSETDLKYSANSSQVIAGVPIVILVNEGTAAASEIVTGALRDHNRATIVGTKTFGRGSIQTIIPLGNGSALKLTTSRWMMPAGDIIEGRGIEPDVTVEAGRAGADDVQLNRALQQFKN